MPENGKIYVFHVTQQKKSISGHCDDSAAIQTFHQFWLNSIGERMKMNDRLYECMDQLRVDFFQFTGSTFSRRLVVLHRNAIR